MRRLPRSNAPQPDESLAGYLLNLAHRLDLPVADLLVRSGLKDKHPSLLDLTWGISLPAERSERLAHATGLTDEEVTNLTVQRWGDRINLGNIAITDHGRRWMPLAATRYCPQCLASTVDHPVWNTAWQLPWTVACIRHSTLLFDRCPTCRTPTGEPGERRFRSLIPNIAYPVSHPAACRAFTQRDGQEVLCDSRLDLASAPPADPALLDLQQRLNTALEGAPASRHSVGTPVDSTQWLKDLRLVCVLVQIAQHESSIANAEYRSGTLTYLRGLEPNQPRGARNQNLQTQAPSSTAVQAGLLLAADVLLHGDGQRDNLSDLVRSARGAHAGITKVTLNLSAPSDGLREALNDSKTGLTDPRRIRPYIPATPAAFGPEHVAAYLDIETYMKHFEDIGLGGQLERPIRRVIPIALVRLVSDLTQTEAGDYLGYTQTLTEASIARASNAFDGIGHVELLRRTARVAEELGHKTRINWAARRAYFDADWDVPDDDWTNLQQTAIEARAARADTPWEQRRPAYAAWIWQQVTHGDIRNAPMIQTRVNGRRCTGGTTKHISDLLRRSAPIVHETVSALAHQYAARIDEQVFAAQTLT